MTLLDLDHHLLLLLPQTPLPSRLGCLDLPLSLLEDVRDLLWPGEDCLVEGEVVGGEGVHVEEEGEPLERVLECGGEGGREGGREVRGRNGGSKGVSE